MGTKYKIGDRVAIKAKEEHDDETKEKIGTIAQISTEALGIKFDGMNEIHKWYVDEEIEMEEPDEINKEKASKTKDGFGFIVV